MSILPIPQTHARAVAVLVDEDDAGGFEGLADGGKVVGNGRPLARFEFRECGACDPSAFGQLSLRPIQEASRGARLLR